jgi:hypothetical protein
MNSLPALKLPLPVYPGDGRRPLSALDPGDAGCSTPDATASPPEDVAALWTALFAGFLAGQSPANPAAASLNKPPPVAEVSAVTATGNATENPAAVSWPPQAFPLDAVPDRGRSEEGPTVDAPPVDGDLQRLFELLATALPFAAAAPNVPPSPGAAAMGSSLPPSPEANAESLGATSLPPACRSNAPADDASTPPVAGDQGQLPGRPLVPAATRRVSELDPGAVLASPGTTSGPSPADEVSTPATSRPMVMSPGPSRDQSPRSAESVAGWQRSLDGLLPVVSGTQRLPSAAAEVPGPHAPTPSVIVPAVDTIEAGDEGATTEGSTTAVPTATAASSDARLESVVTPAPTSAESAGAKTTVRNEALSGRAAESPAPAGPAESTRPTPAVGPGDSDARSPADPPSTAPSDAFREHEPPVVPTTAADRAGDGEWKPPDHGGPVAPRNATRTGTLRGHPTVSDRTPAASLDPGLGNAPVSDGAFSGLRLDTVRQGSTDSLPAGAGAVRLQDGEPLSEKLAARLADAPGGDLEMEVQLDPPEMGRLLVKLVRSEGGLRASFVVSSESARLAVQNEMPALQRALEQAGVTLTGFSVAQHGQGHAGDRSAEEPALRSRYNNRATSPGRSSTAEAYARPIRQGAIDLKV